MMDRFNAPMVEQAIPQGCRTLCQYPRCRVPIAEVPPGWPGEEPFWVHIDPPNGPQHAATPAGPVPLALPREVFTDPATLVDLLADAAEAHGWTVDRSEHTRRTLLLWARTLPQILIQAQPEPTCSTCGEPVRLVGEEPLLETQHADGSTDHKARIGGVR